MADAVGDRSPGSVHRRHPKGHFERDDYFQGVMTKLLAGLNCKVFVDDIMRWGTNSDDFPKFLEDVLGRLEGAGLFAVQRLELTN